MAHHGIGLDTRHIQLLAHLMTYRGEVLGIHNSEWFANERKCLIMCLRMEIDTSHWGEFIDDQPSTSGDDVKCVDRLLSDALTYQQSQYYNGDLIENEQKRKDSIEMTEVKLDPCVLHTIELLQYKRYCLSKPTMKPPNLPEMRQKPLFNEDIPKFGSRDCYEIVRKSTAALIAHVGYEDSECESLETMTDLLSEYLEKICNSFKKIHERRLIGEEAAFSSSIQQLITHVGLNSIQDLKEFYDRRIIGYHDRLLAQCQDIHNNEKTEQDKTEIDLE